MLGTSGSRSSSGLLGATRTITRSEDRAKFCWNSRFRSAVRNTSNALAAARRSNSPFPRPAQFCCCTVRTSWPASSCANCRGSCSSSRTRTGRQCFVGGFEGGHRLLARDGREGVQKLVEAVPVLQVIDKIPQRYASSDEDRRPAQNFRVAMHDGPLILHSPLLRMSLTHCARRLRFPFPSRTCPPTAG